LVESNTQRLKAIETGEQIVVGVNKYQQTEPSPLSTGEDAIQVVPEHVERDQIERLNAWREARDPAKVEAALTALREAAQEDRNVLPASIEAAKVGITTGEWAGLLREVYGEYRAPTGVSKSAQAASEDLSEVRARVDAVSEKLRRRLKFLVGKPGLDGHSNGAEQIAVRARDRGMEVVYEGIRLTPAEIVNAALEEGVHVVGLSILSGSHVQLVTDLMGLMREAGLAAIPVVVGGIIPPEDEKLLLESGVARVYTPKDFQLNDIMMDIVEVVDGLANKAA
ncbi:MAG: methylmalonyl-CoA mutase family protein, partial [Pseudomonadota bacterium]